MIIDHMVVRLKEEDERRRERSKGSTKDDSLIPHRDLEPGIRQPVEFRSTIHLTEASSMR